MAIGRGTRMGQLLLFLTLLFGVATMHTVGHPSSGHGAAPHAPTAAHASAAAAGERAAPGAARPAGVASAAALTSHAARATHAVDPAGAVGAIAPADAVGARGAAWAAGPGDPAPDTVRAGHATALAAHSPSVQGNTGPAGSPASGSPHGASGPTAAADAPLTDRPAGIAPAAAHAVGSSDPAPGVMDPGLVCLAVLGAWGVALLVLVGGLVRRRGRRIVAGVPHRTTRRDTLRADPPHPRILLAQLSVLRI